VTRLYNYSRKWKPTVGVGLVALVLSLLSCNYDLIVQQGFNLFCEEIPVTFAILRTVFMAVWPVAPEFAFRNAEFLIHVPQGAASLWPLLEALGG